MGFGLGSKVQPATKGASNLSSRTEDMEAVVRDVGAQGPNFSCLGNALSDVARATVEAPESPNPLIESKMFKNAI